ncbi:MAG: phage tail tube protein [Accumulibacter sp.]|uniref:phage tail tube protein n=1 Tax=Accumulibacter sp. TaxID=2053492 RepID=UPI003316034A
MATRYIRNTAILAKIESTYGTDSTPTEGANALLVSNVSINPLSAANVDRDLVRPYMGASEQLVGPANIELSFDIELSGAGAAGTAAAYGPLLRACGFAETLSASVRAEYNLVTPVADSVSIYYFSDGVKHIAKGCRGTLSLKMSAGGRPVLSFKFLGLDGGVTAASPSALTLTGFKTPAVISEPNTGDLTFGATYTAATPTLTGGTGYPSQGIELDLGNAVNYTPLLGGESVDISQRQVTGKILLDLTAAQEVTFMASVKANTQQSLGLMHGTTAGYKVMIFMPAAQLINPSKSEVNGKLMIGYDIRALPSSGNDELKIVVH